MDEQKEVVQDVSLDSAEGKDHALTDDHGAAGGDAKDQDSEDKATSHIKQDSVDSYNTSSSSESSVQYAEADSGDLTAEAADEAPSTSRTPSLDNKFSRISLDSTSPTKSTSMTLDTSAEAQKRASAASNATASSVDTGAMNEQDRLESPVVSSPKKRVSLAPPETPSSPNHSESLLAKQLDAHSVDTAAAENGNDRRRDSVDDGTTGSALESVRLSDSRPTSEVFSPLANDFSSSFQEVEMPLGTTPPAASTSSGLPLDADTNGKHLSATGSNMQRSPTGQSTASSSHNYDLIQQRAETHHADLEDHPKRHRRTLRGSQDLRHNFEKLREEMNTPAPASPVHDTPPTGAPHEPQHIDWDFWGEVMSDYEGIAKTRPRDLSKAIQNGIPPALRGMMWQLMSASKDPDLEATYSQLLRLPSTHEKAILRDLNRTFPTHEYFHDKAGVGQSNLLNIMKAYSLYDDEVGYCQGMAFVVGPLLLNMPDEEAFCVLVRLMKSYDLRSQYIPDMPGLQLRLYQFDRLLEELLPAVFMHLLRQGIKSSMYASQWFLTLLAYRFPLELVCSVFDLIFAEGVEAIFRFALAVMKRNEDKIVTMEFEQVLEFLKTGLFEEYKHQMEEGKSSDDAPTYSVQLFVKEALQVKITPMMLDQYTSEWTEMCRQQNAQSAEVEHLRAINKKLSQQVRHLEGSLAQINQEHCELVKQVVATRLEKEELEDELVRVKMALAQESLLREEGRGSIASRGSYASYTSSGPMSPHEERRDSQLSIPKS